jgi:hypothetical protein
VSTLFSANVDNFDCYVFPVKSSLPSARRAWRASAVSE